MSLLTGYDKSQVGSEVVALHGNAPLLFSNAFSEADKVKSPEPISRGDARSSSAGAPWGMTGEIRKRQNTVFLIVRYSVKFSVCFTQTAISDVRPIEWRGCHGNIARIQEKKTCF